MINEERLHYDKRHCIFKGELLYCVWRVFLAFANSLTFTLYAAINLFVSRFTHTVVSIVYINTFVLTSVSSFHALIDVCKMTEKIQNYKIAGTFTPEIPIK